MALPHVIIASLTLFVTQLASDIPADQMRLARMIAQAATAEDLCRLPGEMRAALAHVRTLQPAFDIMNDPGDAKAVFIAGREARAAALKLGAKVWCQHYMAERHLWLGS